jgi:hypothetical protein
MADYSYLGAERTIPGTVNASIVSYYQSTAFKNGLAKSTQDSRRAILERFRGDHGDKRVALMHSTALQNIFNSKSPTAQLDESATRLGRPLSQLEDDQEGSSCRSEAGQDEEDRRSPSVGVGRVRAIRKEPCRQNAGALGLRAVAPGRAVAMRRRADGTAAHPQGRNDHWPAKKPVWHSTSRSRRAFKRHTSG